MKKVDARVDQVVTNGIPLPQIPYKPLATSLPHKDTISFSKAEQHGEGCIALCLKGICKVISSIFSCICSCFYKSEQTNTHSIPKKQPVKSGTDVSNTSPVDFIVGKAQRFVSSLTGEIQNTIEKSDQQWKVAFLLRGGKEIDERWMGVFDPSKNLVETISNAMRQQLQECKTLPEGEFYTKLMLLEAPDSDGKHKIYQWTASYSISLKDQGKTLCIEADVSRSNTSRLTDEKAQIYLNLFLPKGSQGTWASDFLNL
jgi:hypothetical protein